MSKMQRVGLSLVILVLASLIPASMALAGHWVFVGRWPYHWEYVKDYSDYSHPSSGTPSSPNATMRFCRLLRVVNNTGEPLVVNLQYQTYQDGGWNWYPNPPGGPSYVYNIPPGAQTFLNGGNGQPITASFARFQATGVNTGRDFSLWWGQDLALAPGGYLDTQDQVFTLTVP